MDFHKRLVEIEREGQRLGLLEFSPRELRNLENREAWIAQAIPRKEPRIDLDTLPGFDLNAAVANLPDLEDLELDFEIPPVEDLDLDADIARLRAAWAARARREIRRRKPRLPGRLVWPGR